jgi:hypothetical protein
MRISAKCVGALLLTLCPPALHAQTGNTAIFTSPGVFTDSQMNEYAQSLLNGCNPLIEFQAVQGGTVFATEALLGCVAVPTGGAVHNANGIAGYANTSSSVAGAHAVGGYIQGRCLANDSLCAGGNSVVIDAAGLTTGVAMVAHEFDTQPQNPSTAYTTVGGAMFNLFTPQTGTFANSFAGLCTSGQVGIWTACYASSDGKAAIWGSVGSLTTSANSASQPINFNTRDGGNVVRTSGLSANSSGNFDLTPFGGQVIVPSLNPTVGIINNAGGFKHKRGTAGCATAANAGATCTTTVTWSTAFADTNYTVQCGGRSIASGVPINGGITAQVAASVTFRTVAATAVAAHIPTLIALQCTIEGPRRQ